MESLMCTPHKQGKNPDMRHFLHVSLTLSLSLSHLLNIAYGLTCLSPTPQHSRIKMLGAQATSSF